MLLIIKSNVTKQRDKISQVHRKMKQKIYTRLCIQYYTNSNSTGSIHDFAMAHECHKKINLFLIFEPKTKHNELPPKGLTEKQSDKRAKGRNISQGS